MGHRGQEPNESTDDAVWQDLVARLESTPRSVPATPPDTDVPLPTDRTTRSASSDAGAGTGDRADLTDRERAEAIFRSQPFSAAGPRDHSAPDAPDDDGSEGFVPDEPPPLGSANPLTVLAWVGAAGGPIALLLITMFWREAPLSAILGLLVVFLAGAGYLVTKLPKHRDLGDDGAEV